MYLLLFLIITFLGKKKINAELPEVSKEVLDTQCQDIKNLYYLCVMIVTGEVNPALENMSLPVLHNARWFTLAIRILRLYLQEKKPSKSLKKMVNFIVTWYFPMHFNLKMKPSIVHAAVHFFNAIGKGSSINCVRSF